MSNLFYVTEPNVINLDNLSEELEVNAIKVINGTTDFEGAGVQPYDTLVIRSETHINNTIKSIFPSLKNIVRIGTGLDNIDIEYCRSEEIAIYNAAGANADAVSEYIVGMMLYSLRRINQLEYDDVLQWNRFKFVGGSISDQNIGLIGFGNIGKSICKKLGGFEYKALYVYDPFLSKDDVPAGVELVESIDEILRRCSVISVQVPLTDDTAGLLGERELSILKNDTTVVNVSHGGVVDEAAVLKCFSTENGKLYIADSVVNEPHGNIELYAHKQVVITPHIASLTHASEREMVRTAILNFLQGHAV